MIVSGSLVLASCGNDTEHDEPEPEPQIEEETTVEEETEPETEDPFAEEPRDEEPDDLELPGEEPVEPEEEPADEFADEAEREGPVDIAYDEDGRYTIQLFSWKTKEFAELRLKEWQEKGYESAFLTETRHEDTTMFRLRVGRFASLNHAEQKLEELNRTYELNAWVDNYDQE